MNSPTTQIEDIRKEADFKIITFSGYKRCEVKKELLKSLFDGKVENACYWCAELICCGAFIDIWDIITIFIGKYVHLANVKLPIYLDIRYNTFKDIVMCGYIDNELKLRNHTGIRELFNEMMVILCNTPKKHNLERSKVKKEELDIMDMRGRLKAPNTSYAQPLFKPDDPKELFIPLNEFVYHISTDSKNMLSACFWIEWLLEFELICKKKKKPCQCERRAFIPVNDKMQCDVIWMIWDAIMIEANKRRDRIAVNKILQALLNLFCIRYTFAVKRKRIYLLYFAVAMLTEQYLIKKDAIQNKEAVDIMKQQLDIIYKEIKKNENSPNKATIKFGAGEFEKTMGKLNIMFGSL